jgi:Tol biopolymer transport system component
MSPGFSRTGQRGLAVLFLAATVLAPGCSKNDSFSLSPCDGDGVNLIVFASNRGTSQYDVYLYDVDNSGFRLLKNLNSSTAADSSPSLSSDGQTIAFVSTRGTSGSDLFVYDRGSCTLGTIPGVNTTGNESQPRFSGDGLRLTFVRDTLGHHRIRMVDGTSYRFVPLPGFEAPGFDDDSPCADRTAGVIAFSTNRGGNRDIELYDRAGDSLVTLAGLNSAADDIEPSLTPDAHYLCFASNRAGGAGGFDIYLYDLTTRALVTPLNNLNSPADDRRPSISAAGVTIAFQSDRESAGHWDVLYYNRTGALLANPPGLASSAEDLHPSLRFP